MGGGAGARGTTRIAQEIAGLTWEMAGLTWEMASLKEDLKSWMSAVSRATSCPVRVASKKATSCLPRSSGWWSLSPTSPGPHP